MKKDDKIIRTGSLMETESQYNKRQFKRKKKEQGKFLLKAGLLLCAVSRIYKQIDQ